MVVMPMAVMAVFMVTVSMTATPFPVVDDGRVLDDGLL